MGFLRLCQLGPGLRVIVGVVVVVEEVGLAVVGRRVGVARSSVVEVAVAGFAPRDYC